MTLTTQAMGRAGLLGSFIHGLILSNAKCYGIPKGGVSKSGGSLVFSMVFYDSLNFSRVLQQI